MYPVRSSGSAVQNKKRLSQVEEKTICNHEFEKDKFFTILRNQLCVLQSVSVL